jgi:hypothetical protein
MTELTGVNAYRFTATLWNRLEGRPRAEDFDRALKAEVRDALWMLSKQWQMGEFIGDDAGSPILAKAHLKTTALTRYQAGSAPTAPLEREVPLETKVENQRIAFEQAGQDISLDIRLLMGRQWSKLVAPMGPGIREAYVREYGFDEPDPTLEADAAVCAHSDVWQQAAAVAARRMDGYRLYRYLKEDSSRHAYDGIPEIDTDAGRAGIDALAARFEEWFERLFYQPVDEPNPSWKPEYLEYAFACSAPHEGSEKVLSADEYYHGHLDWYNLNISHGSPLANGEPEEGQEEGEVEDTITRTFIPTSVTFGGMPDARWWTFEDWTTNLSFVRPDTTDLNKLLLLDFFLTYSNDWFILPVTLPVGTLADIEGLMVTNVFGEKIWVEAAGRGPDEAWHRWNMFTLAVQGTEDVPAEMTTVVLPVARKVQEGKPLEEVFLLRDEIANMVWGVETRVPLATGRGHPGKETAHEYKAKLQQLVSGDEPPVPAPDAAAAIRFRVVNSVPENWIPFVPVHVDGSRREVQLQRASLPRILEHDTRVPRKIEPRTSLLREGLEVSPKRPYFIHEGEIARAGIRVEKSFQRTRWYNGAVYTWVGIRKQVGRGEGRSGLAFDQIIPTRAGE